MTISIHYEQAVYGSFPFWDKGYAVLARSPGCREDWLTELRLVCQRYGEQPSGTAEAGGLFALRLPAGPWVIVRPSAQGNDDQGRPGALAFHALFVSPRDYRRAGSDPFAFAGLLRTDWTADTRTLPPGVWKIKRPETANPRADAEVARIVSELSAGRRIALQSDQPIDRLAHDVWLSLPARVRNRASLATWAFGNANTFDFVALPRLAGAELDASYVIPPVSDASEASSSTGVGVQARGDARVHWRLRTPSSSSSLARRERARTDPVPPTGTSIPSFVELVWQPSEIVLLAEERPADAPSVNRNGTDSRRGPGRSLAYWGLAALLSGGLLGVAWRHRPESSVRVPLAIVHDRMPPDRAKYVEEWLEPGERAKVSEALVVLADRFGISPVPDDRHGNDPTNLMIGLARRLRYRGPYLSSEELARLEHEPRQLRDLALAWHAHARRFTSDRPLPADFASGPLCWQLDTLRWSFHLDDLPAGLPRSPGEISQAFADALAVNVSLRPNALNGRYPALSAYAEFLGKLPRR